VLEIVRFVDVDEGVEAFVHPGVATLVEADDHREPGVTDLVRRDPE
jgi:hypothetical protein